MKRDLAVERREHEETRRELSEVSEYNVAIQKEARQLKLNSGAVAACLVREVAAGDLRGAEAAAAMEVSVC